MAISSLGCGYALTRGVGGSTRVCSHVVTLMYLTRGVGGEYPGAMTIDRTAIIEGAGVRLRPFTLADAADLKEAANDADTQYWTHVPRNYSEENAHDYIGREGLNWVITAPEFGDRYCGHISVRINDDMIPAVAIGYMTAPWARGKGLQTEALRALARFLVASGVNRVEICAATENRASRKVAERAGGVFEGIRRNGEYIDGRIQDLAVYAIVPTDLVADDA